MNEATFKQQAKDALSKCKIIDNKDGTVNVIGNLNINFPFQYLPKINELHGNFICIKNNSIKTLEGSPLQVIGNFVCTKCDSLQTLIGAPETVTGSFECNHCKNLETLEGAPKVTGKSFYCNNCPKLTSIEHASLSAEAEIYCFECNSLPENAKTYWLKKQEQYQYELKQKQKEQQNRISLETIKTNQSESTWKNWLQPFQLA